MAEKEFLKKILVPIDQSASSVMAEEVTADVAKHAGAAVTVLHVVPMSFQYAEMDLTYSVPSKVTDEIVGLLEQKGERAIDEARALFGEEKVPVETELLKEYDAADTILQYSRDGFDLIVMGAHGENEKDPYALGSVTKKVMTHTKSPTLIVKKVTKLKSMLVCTDGSERSIKALAYAVKLAGKVGSKITLLNVQDHRLHEVSPRAAQELGEQIVSKAVETVGRGNVNIEKRLEVGVASDTIVQVAEKGKHDVIVLGSRGLSTVKRFLLGSVTDDVTQKARCSVLIVP
jgi:nucleotide-binding universal stress UspA family protein